MTWSRILNTNLADAAYWRIVSNEADGCEYHNWNHVMSMYQYLEDTNVQYDETLDWAVLFHDAVYDAEPDKERRSADLFYEMSEEYRGINYDIVSTLNVGMLIGATADHSICTNSSSLERAIIRADLHALTNKAQTINNFVKIMDESIALYGCSVEQFAKNNKYFMEGLRERIMLNVLMSEGSDVDFFNSVLEGIETTIRLAEAVS